MLYSAVSHSSASPVSLPGGNHFYQLPVIWVPSRKLTGLLVGLSLKLESEITKTLDPYI